MHIISVLKLLFPIVLLLSPLNAQINRDSLSSIVDSQIKDGTANSSTLVIIRKLAESYHKDNWQKSFDYYDLLGNVTRDKNLNYWSIGLALKGKGNLHYEKGNYTAAINEYFEAMKLYESNNDELNVADMYSYIAFLYYSLDDYTTARELYQQAAVINKKFVNKYYKDGFSHNLLMLVTIDLEQGKYIEAENLARQSLDVNISLNDSLKIARSFLHIGKALRLQNRANEALKNINAGLEIITNTALLKDEHSRVEYQVALLQEKTAVFLDRQLTAEAFKLLEETYQFSIKNQYLEGELASQIKINRLYLAQKNYPKVIKNMSLILEDKRFTEYRKQRIEVYELLYKSSEKLKNFKTAFRYRNLAANLSDSVKSAKIYQNINQLQAIYNIEQQKREAKIFQNKLKAEKREKIYIYVFL